jgi:hypothetical protein
MEVRSGLLEVSFNVYLDVLPGDPEALGGSLRMALRSNDIPGVMEILNALIADVPYDHWQQPKESTFHLIVHFTFKLLGVDIASEVHCAGGRCDAIVRTSTHIYALEFKLDENAQIAVDQILEKNYLQPYQADKRKKIAIGINFSSEDRKIKDYLVKEL